MAEPPRIQDAEATAAGPVTRSERPPATSPLDRESYRISIGHPRPDEQQGSTRRRPAKREMPRSEPGGENVGESPRPDAALPVARANTPSRSLAEGRPDLALGDMADPDRPADACADGGLAGLMAPG